MEMGYRQYARHRGVTLGAVQKAISSNRISVNANGKIDAEAADTAWTINTDASRVAMNVLESPSVQQQQTIPLPPASAPMYDKPEEKKDEDLTGNDRTAKEYREHRSTRERYQALTMQLEYEQLVGTLIKVDDAKRIAFTSFRAMRDSIMNVAARIKDQLAAETDAHICEQLLENELSAALAAIDIGKLLTDQDE